MTEIREMQLEIVKMMENVDSLFSDNGIAYTLLGGSVLGAVRHKGFIPWDDDMDIGVFRDDFDNAEKLLSQMSEYVYERAENHIVPDAPIGHLHLVNEKYPIENSPTIDVFALDKVPSDEKARKQLRRVANLHHLCVLRKAPKNRGKVKRMIVSALLIFIPNCVWNRVQKYTLGKIEKLNGKNFSCIGNIFGAWTEREYFDASIYKETERIQFENLQLPCPKNVDFYLSQLYGNYMQLPPKEKQVPKHREF